MSYNIGLPVREQMMRDLQPDINSLYICPTRKTFNAAQNKMAVLFEDSITDNQLLELVLYHNVRHIVQNSIQPVQGKLELVKKLSYNSDAYFDVDFALLSDTAANKIFEFNHLTSRDRLIHQICEFANLDPTSSRSTRPLQTVEELVMNAQVNAVGSKPKDAKIMSHLKVEFQDNLLAFSAIDPYGLLDIKKFLKKIEAGHALGLDQSMNFGKGGAGVGSSLIFQNSDTVFLGVLATRKTRVSVIMPYNVTERKYDGMQKSIHIFNSKKGSL